MTSIRTNCPSCGVVEVSSSDILLTYDDKATEGFYEFGCPACHEVVQKDADGKIAAILRSVGVQEAIPERRAAYPEKLPDDGTPINKGEVAEFILDLHNEDYLADRI